MKDLHLTSALRLDTSDLNKVKFELTENLTRDGFVFSGLVPFSFNNPKYLTINQVLNLEKRIICKQLGSSSRRIFNRPSNFIKALKNQLPTT